MPPTRAMRTFPAGHPTGHGEPGTGGHEQAPEHEARRGHAPGTADRQGRAPLSRADADITGAVEEVLGAYLDTRLAEATEVDAVFADDVAERVKLFALRGGKRWRAAFAWWGWRAGGGADGGRQAVAALNVAAALELIQTCALIHDDVMDASALRRGAPSVHVDFARQHEGRSMRGSGSSFGRSAAILAGDLALAWADDLVAESEVDTGARRRMRHHWQAMRTEMVAGQYLELHAQAAGSASLSRAVRIACLKSALYTVERPLALGAALAGADDRTTAALCSAGRCAGIAFQLRDDLVGVFGDPALTGKPAGDDIREGKLTYLVAVARSRADASGDAAALDVLAAGLGAPDLTDVQLDRVRTVLEETGARAAVESKIERLVLHSRRHLRSAPMDPRAHNRLSELLAVAAGVNTAASPITPSTPITPRTPNSPFSSVTSDTAITANPANPANSPDQETQLIARGPAPATRRVGAENTGHSR
ncbi:polyprenyl synthetase family protein [Streptomyces sp. H27-C3]|uniref:polyprenyl synthetase family protein n=1 Tax=Streptomyces sp. H27-C3 TaxID=3046305 RepID=UPI0024B90406|nr:polyprenyl synthetase family protein [Streptomyces sp. H27-C3]MDJ0462643.1 polyprenyl synthetase family protein [Streptomyces sp. H27-C3]